MMDQTVRQIQKGFRRVLAVLDDGKTWPSSFPETSQLPSILLARDYIPRSISMDELTAIIRIAANDFSRDRLAVDNPGVAFQTLINILLERHFLLTHLGSAQPNKRNEAEMILDLLIWFGEEGLGDVAQSTTHEDAFRQLFSLSLRDTAADVTSRQDSYAFTIDFCKSLAASWRPERDACREMQFSPMPWSAHSRDEGIPPPITSYDEQAPVAMITGEAEQTRSHVSSESFAGTRDDFVCFPDMTWIGGRHDGYPRAISLSAYVWIRLSTARSRKEYLALWQSALSFGVLEAITGMKIPETLLLELQPDGSLSMTSKHVSLLITSWLFGHLVPHISPIQKWIDHAHKIVHAALSAIDESSHNHRHGRRGSPFRLTPSFTQAEVEDIVCCLTSLSAFFTTVVALVQNRELKSRHAGYAIPAAASRLAWAAFRRRMAAHGWCPSTPGLLNGLQVMGEVSRLVSFVRNPGTNEHAACTNNDCVASNLDPAKYETQHAPGCPSQSCPVLLPPFARVSELLSSGYIPVIIYKGGTLAVRNAAEGPFLAISHVWADGLGSTTEEGLPACQVSRISQHARDLLSSESDGAFWVDSLCVPAAKELRKRAIRLMAETYTRAEKVIVFDTSVRTFCNASTTRKEVFLRISTSPWMQRVWTLQEACLTRELYFEVSDGLVSLQRLATAMHRAQIPKAESVLGR
ncbi:hypothetical protein C8Q80DRAFT_1226746, partial [Daedaleopsis nitida]